METENIETLQNIRGVKEPERIVGEDRTDSDRPAEQPKRPCAGAKN